ncbi:4-aminobutyrate--2-oxoglutarate transaminase [Gimesia aquarii]|uniref:5-aminovalerate aminotransferase DavT n=1 Tax=Gimesia aquarii TaxID=2527964 RepID=A0A517WWN0_9PLAN|nr:4-aminobutyrate--2-oxoglutarate transaminase [Gimesia aquarii]QDU09675.1 5-aminovalerate aminotransferase DavT [Gimesia aquarii]
MNQNEQLQQRKLATFAQGQGNAHSIFIQRAENAELWDVEGRRYIDFGAGIAVVNTGHCHPKVKTAVAEQLEHFSHTCVMVTPYESAVALAEKLNEAAPISTECRTIFVTSGAEAVENSIKIARAHTGRRGVIAFQSGFHGRTNMTMGLTGKITPYKKSFGPFPAEIYHVPFPMEYHGVSVEDANRAIETLFKVDIAPEDVAALIIEPVLGEGGFYPAPDHFLSTLRKTCDQHGIVFIADEIQTGFGRTGKMFCMQHSGVEPDLITQAKGIAGGIPIAAVTGKASIMNSPHQGGLGGTYGGSPLGCAAGLAVLEVIAEEQLIERANEIGQRFMSHLSKIQQQFPDHVGHIRNRGAMIAMELVKSGDPNQPDAPLTKSLVTAAADQGLILLSCGMHGNVIRFLPPLTIPMELIDEGMAIVADCIASLSAQD